MTDNFNQFGHNYRLLLNINLKKTGFVSSYFSERKVREIARQNNKSNKNMYILDLGCGDGECVHFFNIYFPGSRIFGIDISENSLRNGLAQNNSSVFILYDGKRMPFQNDSFDVILIANVLHHVTDNAELNAILKECRRILKKFGKVFIFEHNPINPLTRRIVASCPFDTGAKLILHVTMIKTMRKHHFISKCRFIIFLPGCLKRFDSLEKFLNWCPLGGQYYLISEKE